MSVSPDPTQQVQQAAEDEVSFRFCRECSNMLYPKEDRNNSQLMFACRTCNFSEPAPSQCVWRNQLTNTVAETAGVTTDVGGDPTLPHTQKRCPQCSEDDVVFFQSQQRTSTTGMVGFPIWYSEGTILTLDSNSSMFVSHAVTFSNNQSISHNTGRPPFTNAIL
ncbi:MAG: hypothetical protein GOMPHAMPRED_004329 [Gomphillus americanus]|uniref:DNA-directed RNA polymerase II subunit RPB9 n=1 Tax=Gomphillus americanus TaxID=1940652 RepID=A0A8H3FM61_9LECA|nr:MAG: hypothetical protein GOMPHAMPRED_004329 [Gomphillus americanus]